MIGRALLRAIWVELDSALDAAIRDAAVDLPRATWSAGGVCAGVAGVAIAVAKVDGRIVAVSSHFQRSRT